MTIADNDSTDACFVCLVPFKMGDMVLQDVSGGTLHTVCCGPERESYVKDVDTGEPLGPNDTTPTGYAWLP